MTNIINAAIKFISNKRCSEQELRIYLDKVFKESSDIENKREAFIYLKEHGVLNDLRLAHHLAAHYSHKGNNFIRHVLMQRGISNKDIDHVLTLLPPEEVRAWEESNKKLLQLSNQSSNNLKANLTRFLMGRNFSFQTINTILGRLEQRNYYETNSFNSRVSLMTSSL